MKRSMTQSMVVLTVLAATIGLNVLLYRGGGDVRETELTGSRSSYSSRPYGTRAYYLLLQQMGLPVRRLEVPLTSLKSRPDLKKLFIINPPQPFSVEEFNELERWVKEGRTLVIIDRGIHWELAGGAITLDTYSKLDQWHRPHVIQPTRLTVGVQRVQLSKFARGVKADNAPVTEHVGDEFDPVLLDFRLGEGRIIMCGDPYIVANNGISQGDNLMLALNLARMDPAGPIAFDEYHHGYGQRRLAQTGIVGVLLGIFNYFRPTPVIWLLAQLSLVAGAWIYSRARRFTKPIPLPSRQRTRSLEFVASMANLARAHGLRPLVVENISRSLRWASSTDRGSFSIWRRRRGTDGPDSAGTSVSKESEVTEEMLTDQQLLAWVREVRRREAHTRRVK